VKQTTLCLLIKQDKILLAMKKRGFGIGRWNGTGGKFDLEKDKNIFDTAKRETKEEIGVDVINPEKVGLFHFYFPHKPEWNQDVHLFVAREWVGDPEESDEMVPKWFSFNKIPYNEMWDDDRLWLPHILNGKKLEAYFTFEAGDKIVKHNIKTVDKL
jgi:8-oxo-dGTP pyrophosphatase MutT (NUDIX family)